MKTKYFWAGVAIFGLWSAILVLALIILTGCDEVNQEFAYPLQGYPGSVLCRPCDGEGPLKKFDLPFDPELTPGYEDLCFDRPEFSICWYECPPEAGSIEGPEFCE
jgi:hypothetical protein